MFRLSEDCPRQETVDGARSLGVLLPAPELDWRGEFVENVLGKTTDARCDPLLP